MNKYPFFIIGFLVCFTFTVVAQQPGKTSVPVDTLKNKSAIELCKKVLANDKTHPLYNRVSVFGNPDCGHCREVEALMKEKNIDFDVYDLRDNKLLMSVHELIVAQKNSEKMAYSYPIILYKGEVYFNFKDPAVFVDELNKKITR